MDTNGHPVSAASGEPEVIGRLRGYADTRLYAIPGEYVCDAAEILNAVATLAQQRDAAVRERDELANWKRETESFSRTFLGFGMTHDNESVWSAMGGANQNYSYYVGQCEQLQAENESLRARLAACEGHLNYIRRVTVGAVESDKLAATCKTIGEYRAVLLKAIDALSLDDDFGHNDGHARTVRRSAGQDAATTRGEGQNDDTDWDYTTPTPEGQGDE